MKEKMLRFLKNKFNITLIVIQMIAIVVYLINGLWEYMPVIFFALEGVFFIVWGVKILSDLKKLDVQQEVFGQMPYTDEERIEIAKRNKAVRKNNKFLAVALIILGAVLFFSLFSVLF